jgi:hypothetical protein
MMPERIQQKRTKGWRKPPNTVSVARPSKWWDPFPVAEYGLELSLALFRNAISGSWNPGLLDQSRDDAYWDLTYRRAVEWRKRIGNTFPSEQARLELAGKNLMCFCPLDQPCHADVLLDIANREDAASEAVRLVDASEPQPGTTNYTRVSKPLRRALREEP